MPTKRVIVATTGTVIVVPNSQRTVLTLANEDAANIIFISDEPSKAVADMFPIFPETFISLPRKQGEEPHKAWYGRTAVQSTLKVLESFGTIAEEEPDLEYDPQQPYSPIDAPLMRKV